MPPSGDSPDTGIWRLDGLYWTCGCPSHGLGALQPGARDPGAEFEEARRSGLFGARPQAAGERGEEQVLLAGFGELGQALLLLLGSGHRWRRVSQSGQSLPDSQVPNPQPRSHLT